MEFAYDGGGLGKGGTVTFYIDGKKAGEGKIPSGMDVFSADDGCDVGRIPAPPVSADYGPRGNEFSGQVRGVQIDIDSAAEDVDHLISAEEAVRIAMARQ